MIKNTLQPPLSGRLNPWLSLLIILLIGIGFYVLGNILGFVLVYFIYQIDLVELANLATAEEFSDTMRNALYILQGFIAFFAFIVSPWVYITQIERKPISTLFQNKAFTLSAILLTAFIVLSFMGVNSLIIEWNMNLDFPDFMERTAREYEEQAKRLTEALTNVSGFGNFLVAFLIIAIIPAVGEELLFRGILQNKLWQISNNVHIAIWVTGLIFSLVHMQFYGLIPRLLLGVLFGYLYYWSGNIVIPMIAHFVNNGFTLTMIYLYNQGAMDYNIEEETSIPLIYVLVYFIIWAGLTYYFRNYMMKKRAES